MISRCSHFLITCFFCTLTADLLHIALPLFWIKYNTLFACLLLLLYHRGIVMEKRFVAPFVFILISMGISTLFSPDRGRSIVYILCYLFKVVAYFLLTFNLMQQEEWEELLKKYWFSFKLMGAYAAVQLFFSYFEIYDPFLRQRMHCLARPHALALEPSVYAFYMSLLAGFVFNKKALSQIGVHALLFISFTTSAVVSYVCLGMAAVVHGMWKRFVAAAALIGAVFAGGFWLFADEIRHYVFKLTLVHGGSFTERWQKIIQCWQIFIAHPFLGVGYGGVGPLVLAQERLEEGFSSLPDYQLEDLALADPGSVFFEILSSLGLVGVFAFGFLGLMIYRSFKETLSAAPSHTPLIRALALSTLVMSLMMQINGGIFANVIWAHLGIVCGVCFHVRHQQQVNKKTCAV